MRVLLDEHLPRKLAAELTALALASSSCEGVVILRAANSRIVRRVAARVGVSILFCLGSFGQPSADSRTVSLRLLHDSVRATRAGSIVTANVQFVAHNVSRGTVYQINSCHHSPPYSVERLQDNVGGGHTWLPVFRAWCTGTNPPGPLAPGDSALFTSPLVEFPGQRPAFSFGSGPGTYRFVYEIESAPGFPSRHFRIYSPQVTVVPPR